MPHSLTGLSSPTLPVTDLRRALYALPAVFQHLVGDADVIAYYGWGCSLHPDLQYVPMRVGMGSLERFISDSLAQEILIPGASDFCLAVTEGRLEVLFCHEGDIHLKGKDQSLINALRNSGFFSQVAFRSPLER
jgi:hypothetical protein